jgi:saccharopine dehydrogenase (NAD+, L-lysine forming)
MTHIWIRAENRPNEQRVGLTPQGGARLIAAGLRITVEQSRTRVIPIEEYRASGCDIAPEGSWPEAPAEAIIFGLKELPGDDRPLHHRHIMFGHAFKGQPDGRNLLDRFRAGGGALYDLEYLTDDSGRRVAAFGYWAGYVGAAVTFLCWAAQQRGTLAGSVSPWADKAALMHDLKATLDSTGQERPGAIVIGALGRVGTGAVDFCVDAGVPTTRWDMAETAGGGPFPEVLDHEVFLNCILATPGCPVFVPEIAPTMPRKLSVIGDIACDPMSEYSPVRVYDRVTDWTRPALRVHQGPPLDVMAIDNLPSLLPHESSLDFSAQLLPHLAALVRIDTGVWARARARFERCLADAGQPAQR